MSNNEYYNVKANLIELVRKYECLYDRKHKKYKDQTHKSILWAKIGANLEMDASTTKKVWRSLRDGYVRYKKQKSGKSGSSRNHGQFTWSSQMTFLDGTIESRASNTNVKSAHEDESESEISRDDSPLPPLSPQPGPSHSDRQTPPALWFLEVDTHSSKQALSKHTNTESLSSTDRSLIQNIKNEGKDQNFEDSDYLDDLSNRYSKTQNCDDVDLLFASYAKTFKRLSPRIQAKLKINLAKIFAEAELQQIDESTCDDRKIW